MSKSFEIQVEEWDKGHTIKYWVSPYTQIVRHIFKTEKELREMLDGIVCDYFASQKEPDDGGEVPRDVKGWEEELKKIENKEK